MQQENLRKIYKKIPERYQSTAKRIWSITRFMPFSYLFRREMWIRRKYEKFGRNQREFIYMSIARFCFINRPITGYYFEFGCHEANTMRLAWRTFKWLFDWEYVAFDSFEGLPEIEGIDKQEIWKKGKLKTTEHEFERKVFASGMPKSKLTTVKGFYDESLNDELRKKLSPKKAAVIYIDCDLYVSTKPVLEFIKPFLQIGTIIVFDDWYCFHGNPNMGERKAFGEFLEENKELNFEKFVQTNEAMSFIYVGDDR